MPFLFHRLFDSHNSLLFSENIHSGNVIITTRLYINFIHEQMPIRGTLGSITTLGFNVF